MKFFFILFKQKKISLNPSKCFDIFFISGAELNTQNKTGNTALHLSAYRGHTEIVKLLVQSGADVFLRNEKGRCASEEAEVGNHSLTAQFLYKKMKGMLGKIIQNVIIRLLVETVVAQKARRMLAGKPLLRFIITACLFRILVVNKYIFPVL